MRKTEGHESGERERERDREREREREGETGGGERERERERDREMEIERCAACCFFSESSPMSQRMLQDDAQKANAPTVLAPRQLPTHRHRHAGEVAPRGYPEGCVAHSSVPCQRNARGAGQAQTSSPDKNHVTSKSPVGDISVVTLIRTDTTLDHSQKAEKVYEFWACVNATIATQI